MTKIESLNRKNFKSASKVSISFRYSSTIIAADKANIKGTPTSAIRFGIAFLQGILVYISHWYNTIMQS